MRGRVAALPLALVLSRRSERSALYYRPLSTRIDCEMEKEEPHRPPTSPFTSRPAHFKKFFGILSLSLTRGDETGSFDETEGGACRPVSWYVVPRVQLKAHLHNCPPCPPGLPLVPLVPKNDSNWQLKSLAKPASSPTGPCGDILGFPLPPTATLSIGAPKNLRSLRPVGARFTEGFLPSVPIYDLCQLIQDATNSKPRMF